MMTGRVAASAMRGASALILLLTLVPGAAASAFTLDLSDAKESSFDGLSVATAASGALNLTGAVQHGTLALRFAAATGRAVTQQRSTIEPGIAEGTGSVAAEPVA